ncbi:MAG: chromosomal replication initiator DnaA [Hyphomonadaceae bacterium]|nr:chromosomal replication initiator DnaA [Hyphomonadaceae bacterium]
MGDRSPDKLVVAEANRDAAKLLTDWRSWPGGALALVGPSGAGKTHLALAWAVEAKARQVSARAAAEDAAAIFREAAGRLLIDDADSERDEAMFWRVLDLARTQHGAVLIVGASVPSTWPVAIPDLRSRLASLPVAKLGEPDEALMDVVLRRICREKFIQLSDDAAKYLVRRLPRTFAAAQAWVSALDEELVRGAKPVTTVIAKRALERMQARWVGGDG